MKLSILELAIRNFKGLSNVDIKLDGRSANIYGDNAIGKTSVYDSFLWCLFGKDSKGKTDFEIVPLTDGKQDRKIEPSVTLKLLVDDEELLLKRTLKPKWVNVRGAEEATFDGYTTAFHINDVPVKQNEYKAKIDSIINENTFKLITNVDTFLNWNKKDQRAYLLSMVQGIDDVEVCKGDPKLLQVVATMKQKNYTPDDILKIVKEKIKDLSKEQDTIPAKIEELNRYVSSTESLEELDKQIAGLSAEIEENSESKRDALIQTQKMLEEGIASAKDSLKILGEEYKKNQALLKSNEDAYCDKCHQKLINKDEFLKADSARLIDVGNGIKKTMAGLEKGLETCLSNQRAMRLPETVKEMRRMMDELKSKRAFAEQGQQTISRIDDLKQRNKDISQLIVQQEGIKASVDKFVRERSYAMQDAVNDLFPTLKFRLFDYKIDGTAVDDCTALINGNVPYSDCSRSESIRAGMEVVNSVQAHTGTYGPIFIDNAESCSWLIDTNCQTIKMYVSGQDKELRVEVDN